MSAPSGSAPSSGSADAATAAAIGGHGRMRTAAGWDEARSIVFAAASAAPAPVTGTTLADAAGSVAATDLHAIAPLPHYDSAAMDGWAVTGEGPWALGDRAVPIVTGALVPRGADAVLPLEQGTVVGGMLRGETPAAGRHIRRAGDEREAGAVLVAAGTRLSPAHLALLAVAGFDTVPTRRASVSFLFTGDEIDTAGAPAPGRVRDAFSPLLPPLATHLGARVVGSARHGDDVAAIAAALRPTGSARRLLVSTGGTGRSSADSLRTAITAVGGEILVDGVLMRPGHPTLVARLPGDRLLLGLPGNPLAAVLAALSFLPPAIDAVTGANRAAPVEGVLADALGAAGRTTLVPVRNVGGVWAAASGIRSHMLTGLAAASAVAVIPPGGLPAGARVRLLTLPW